MPGVADGHLQKNLGVWSLGFSVSGFFGVSRGLGGLWGSGAVSAGFAGGAPLATDVLHPSREELRLEPAQLPCRLSSLPKYVRRLLPSVSLALQ